MDSLGSVAAMCVGPQRLKPVISYLRYAARLNVVPSRLCFPRKHLSSVYDSSDDLRENTPQQNFGAMA